MTADRTGSDSVALGLYVHVPFCASKCRYCDFYSEPVQNDLADRYVAAVRAEGRMRSDGRRLTLGTVYMGGGTPSVLTPEQWEGMLELPGEVGTLPEDMEWTVECNPDSFDAAQALRWQQGGVTRVSIGVQSLEPRLLRFLGRRHTAKTALGVLHEPVMEGFQSVGVDVMYGIPGQTMESLRDTVEQLLACPWVHHVSAYELTLSPKSLLGRHLSLLPPQGEEASAAMYSLVEDLLVDAGFEHYEVSNYARPGHRSRHNMSYWYHVPYVGLGPSAHSFEPPCRSGNVRSVDEYLRMVGDGILPVEGREELTTEELGHELVMLGLRTNEGVDSVQYEETTGEAFSAGPRSAVIMELTERGLMHRRGTSYVLTSKGMLLADAIAERLT